MACNFLITAAVVDGFFSRPMIVYELIRMLKDTTRAFLKYPVSVAFASHLTRIMSDL